MKKSLFALALSLLLLGCTEKLPEGIKRNTQIPAVEKSPEVTVDDFYFEAGKSGLILKLITDESFSQPLSTNEIESAEIADGILTFVEKVNGGSQTQVFHLAQLAKQMNR